MEPLGEVLVAIAIALGLVGIVVAAIPGLILIWAAVMVWALGEQTPVAWTVLALATALTIGGQVVKYLVPGHRLRDAGIPGRSMLAGAALSIVGFFVIPLVGFIIGFVLGVYLAEWYRLGTQARAWPSTKQAMKAAGLSILIELAAGLLIAGAWVVAVIFL